MSTKPTTLPRWATDLSNNDEPSSGQKDTGWTPGQDGVSDYDNWKSYWAYKWCEWVSDSLNDGTADYALTANVNDADLAGTGDLTNINTVYVTPDDDWEINGILGGVDKQEIQLVNTGSFFFWLTNQGPAATAANRIVFPSHFVLTNFDQIHVLPGGSVRLRYHAASSRWKLVSLTGCRVPQRITLPATLASSTGTNTVLESEWTQSDTYNITFPVVVPTGSLIDSWTVYCYKSSSGAVTLTAQLKSRTGAAGTNANVGGSDTNNDNAPGYIQLDSGGSFTVAREVTDSTPTVHYRLDVGAGSGAGDNIIHADIIVYTPV